MRLLLDTHLLIWAAERPTRLSSEARDLLLNSASQLFFSAISVLEVSIKSSLGRSDFSVDPERLRLGLLQNEYVEMQFTAAHAVAVTRLPPIHKDPFDRSLVAQAQVEGTMLVTADPMVARYPGPIRLV